MYENKKKAIKAVFFEWWSEDWRKIKAVRKNENESFSPIEQLVIIPLLFFRIFGLFNFFYILIRKLIIAICTNKFKLECVQNIQKKVDKYVFISVVLFIISLFIIKELPHNIIKIILFVIMWWRIIEILNTSYV